MPRIVVVCARFTKRASPVSGGAALLLETGADPEITITLGGVAAKVGIERITEQSGRIAKLAAQAKSGCLQTAIKDATRGQLHTIIVEISGQVVSIRAKAKRREYHQLFRRRIESLRGLDGFQTVISIE